MGEYAKDARGEQVKIGTCEEMYYLRFDQRDKVEPMSGNVDPVADAEALRFRFPWPDEDMIEPGCFDDYNRSVAIPGFPETSGDFEHHNLQFTAPGYVVSLPCPESKLADPFGVSDGRKGAVMFHRNGHRGRVLLVQQRYRPEIGLVPVLMCGGCGAKYRLEDRAEIEALAVACRSEGDNLDRRERISREFHDRENTGATPIVWAPMPSVFWHKIADRILAGITETVAP